MFLRSVDASDKVKDATLLFELLDDIIQEVGVGNVVIDGKGDGKGGALETTTRQREHET